MYRLVNVGAGSVFIGQVSACSVQGGKVTICAGELCVLLLPSILAWLLRPLMSRVGVQRNESKGSDDAYAA